MGKLRKNKKEKINGSILVFTLIIMFIVLAGALGVAGVSVMQKKSSISTGESTVAFQVADSGLEEVLVKINKESLSTVNDLVNYGGMSCSVEGGVAVIAGDISGNSYNITFMDDSGAIVTECDSSLPIGSVKSVGRYKSTTRAIEINISSGP